MKIEDVKLALYCNTTENCECCVEFDGTDDNSCIKKVDRITAMILQAEIERLENKALDMLSEKFYQPVWCADNKQWDIVMGCDSYGLDFAVLGYLTINQVKEMTFYKHKPNGGIE